MLDWLATAPDWPLIVRAGITTVLLGVWGVWAWRHRHEMD